MEQYIFGFNKDLKWDYENGFYLTSHTTRIAKLLAQYELYKLIVHLPGHIVEFGVFKGASLIRFLTFREILENPYSRKVIGFDAFGNFPNQDASTADNNYIKSFERVAGSGISIKELELALTYKKFINYHLVQGEIAITLPEYIKNHPELKIALLHIDVDVYNPTKIILENLFDRVVQGGLVVFDDYGTVEGETKAVDDFFRDKSFKIEKLPISHIPSYIRK